MAVCRPSAALGYRPEASYCSHKRHASASGGSMKPRKHLSAEGLIRHLHHFMTKIKNPRPKEHNISLVDCLMSCFAIFHLKWPSLLEYDIKKKEPLISENLRSLYLVKNAPSDTYMRERLDEIPPQALQGAFKRIFALAQRSKDLEPYRYLDDYYFVSNDGTGYFSSPTINCENCCCKQCSDGSFRYYHQILAAVLVHPELKTVIPLEVEEMCHQDGLSKNDCERNASQRLLSNLRRHHPHLPMVVVEDALHSNGPHLLLLHKLNLRHITGVKPADHKLLFDWVKHLEKEQFTYTDAKGTIHTYHFVNGVPLNDTYFDLKVNFIEYWEKDKMGRVKHWTWITDFTVTLQNVVKLVHGARARWKIENETFNTLKNQGYHFEHNYGHGKHLCGVMAMLMMLAFLIDQIQMLSCRHYAQARRIGGRFSSFCECIRVLFRYVRINSWDALFGLIAERRVLLDTA